MLIDTPVERERIRPRGGGEPRRGDYVLYWMQASVRSEHNPALEYAIHQANHLARRLVVCFGLTEGYPEASERHYRFLLEGLADAAAALKRRNIKFVMRRGDPAEVAIGLAREACAVVTDVGYLRHQRRWRRRLAAAVDAPVTEVEGDVVVPVEVASDKREYAARTIRPRIHRHLGDFLADLPPTSLDKRSLNLSIDGEDVEDADALLASLDIDRSVPAVGDRFRGGASRARARLRAFLRDGLTRYEEHRNQPQTDDVSHLSMYLHYGHTSPVYAALRARESGAPKGAIEAFLEELIVRRELNLNYVTHEPDYDRYSALPDWTRKTLAKHRDDEREHIYTRRALAEGRTHDRYWNAAMAEMRETGYLHNYMRMYWGKKILEWTNTPEHAFRTALALNNAYLLDGRDPNSFGNVAWVFGLHDRPWGERPIFGTVRYMAASGLERKTDPDAYVRKVEEMTGLSLS